MNYIYPIIKADYLQRTRSYSFLITLAATVYIAYLFLPPTDASYTTLSVDGFKGAYNSAWVGHISAIMTTMILAFCGFPLVNNSIKKDIDTEVGLIIATTPISNFKYLLSKQLSNYLVLCTIIGCTFIVSLMMFYVRGTGYPFVLSDFIVPYLSFALPAMFLVATMAVIAEVFLGKRSILQFILYFLFLSMVLSPINRSSGTNLSNALDPFGLTLVTNSIKNHINSEFHAHVKDVSFGFIFSGPKPFKLFTWDGINLDSLFILSRLLWIAIGIVFIYISSFFFHRFNFKQSASRKKVKSKGFKEVDETLQQAGPGLLQKEKTALGSLGINRAKMPPLVTNYSILPFIKTELLLLARQGNKWVWIVNGGLWISMFFAPLNVSHNYLLPILLFLQVTRWSELTTKEKTNRVHYFTYASYKPLSRMLVSQVLAGVILAVTLALPVLLRYAIALDTYSIINILNGAIFIVLLAASLGIVSGSKKLYEILFFLITYAVINKVDMADYLGGFSDHQQIGFFAILLTLNISLISISIIFRKYQARHL